MIIGLDAKRAVANHTGLGNYSRLTIDILARNNHNDHLRLFIPKRKPNQKFDKLLLHDNVLFALPNSALYRKFSSVWRSWKITNDIRLSGVDIYHGLSNELPIGIRKTGVKSIVTIHDLIFLRHPEFYPYIDRKIYKIKFRYACTNADRIIAVSECTKRDIIAYYKIPAEKIDVIYQGCNPIFATSYSQEEVNRIKHKYNLPEQFILNVGSIEARKNLLLIVKAMKQVASNVKLVAIGKSTLYTQMVNEYIQQNNLQDRVIIRSDISNEDLPKIYQAATIFAYPSFYEGFGIPIIEALSAGVPVIAAKGSCLEEAGGEHSIYVDPNDEKEVAEKINLLLNNPTLRHEISLKGKQYVTRFSEENQANELLAVYKKTLASIL